MSKIITITQDHKTEGHKLFDKRFANLRVGAKMKSLLKIKWQKAPDGVSYYLDPDKPYQEMYFPVKTANRLLARSANQKAPLVSHVENIHELTKYGYIVQAEDEPKTKENTKPSRRRG